MTIEAVVSAEIVDGYCSACGKYVPKTLSGERAGHCCGRTPPVDGLPPDVYACPVCFGFGLSRWGCWGTREHPHEHRYMRPVYELLRERLATTVEQA